MAHSRALQASAVLMVLLSPAPTRASSCVEVPFAKLAAAADVIFVGTAISIDGELATTFQVERVYKGETAARVVVETGGVKYAMLAPPHRYLVLADAGNPDAAPGHLYGHPCGGSQREPWAAEITAQLGDGWPANAAAVAPKADEPGQRARPRAEAPPASPSGGCASCSIDRDVPASPWALAGVSLLWAVQRRRRPHRP